MIVAQFWSAWELPLATILAGVLSSLPCAILGCFLVLRRMSLLGDAISHSVLPGIVIGALLSGNLLGWPVFLGAVVMGVLTAILTQSLTSHGNVSEDAGMGVVFTSFFALGVILITQLARNVDLDPGCVLYGLIEFIPLDTVKWGSWEVPRAFFTLVPVCIVTILFTLLFWKELLLSSFDPALATSMGFSSMVLHYLLMGLVAVVSVASFEAVGSVLVIAMLIVPPATAHLLTDRLGRMIVLSVLCSISASIVGYWGATRWNTSVAGMMSVVAGLQFLLALVFAPRYGLISRTWHNLSLSFRIIAEDVIAALFRAEEEAPQSAGLKIADCFRLAGGGWGPWLLLPLLKYRGLVLAAPQGRLQLTEKGRTRARSLVRSHRLWEAFMEKHFDLPADHLHAPASRVEHYIGPELQDKLKEELRGPDVDPHGRQIP
ncbi:MAG: metal ABC transporter permease [Planctomycetales bacterium]